MVHMIDMTGNRANMAYVGETPWHGLGTVLQPGASLETWTQAAGLGWTALKLPSYYEIPARYEGAKPGETDMVKSKDKFHIVRDDTYESLGVMSEGYHVVQPKDVLDFFQHFILTDDRFQLETAGSLKAGRVIWALAKFQEAMDCAGDEHVPYVLLTTSYNGSLATTAQATMIRVVCNNTLTAAVYAKSNRAVVKVAHSTRWTPEVVAHAHDQLASITGDFAVYRRLAEALAGVRMAKSQTEDFLKRLSFPKGETEASAAQKSQYDALFRAWAVTATETEGNTAWAALNGVTRFVDHDRNTRMKGGVTHKAQAQMSSAFFGTGAALKAQALGALAESGKIDLKALATVDA